MAFSVNAERHGHHTDVY